MIVLFGVVAPTIQSMQGTNYQRVMPNREIDAKNRDKFWAQTEKEEVKRRELEAKRTEEENKKLDQERKEREVGLSL